MRISDWSSDVCSSDLLGEGVRLPDRTAIGVPVFLRIDARGVGAVARIHSAVCRARKKDAPVEAICRAPIAAKLQAEGFRDRSAHDDAELGGGVVAGGSRKSGVWVRVV